MSCSNTCTSIFQYTRCSILVLVISFFCLSTTEAQGIDILLKGGHLVDPANNIDAPMDVAISGDKILKIARNIPANGAKKLIDATGLFITPGFIDIHTHVFVGPENGFANGFSSVSPDDFSFKSGVTTVVDAGTSGPKNFHVFKAQVIDRSQTRVLSFLNVFDSGFSSGSAIPKDINSTNPQMAADTINKYKESIVGMRIGHYSGTAWTPFDLAIQAAERASVPLLVECHLPALSLEGQLQRMRPGDIITHAFEQVSERTPVVDSLGKVRPFVLVAQKKGVLFDVGHGGAGFWFSQAIPAMEQGLLPSSFGSDLHRFSMNSGMKSMLNIMSKYLNMGMSMHDVIERATSLPAKSIQRPDLGQVAERATADLAIISVQKGNFGFIDAGGNKIKGKQKFEAEMTIRAGKIVYDLNGLGAKDFVR